MVPSPWEKRSFLRGMRQGGAEAREISPGNLVRVGQNGATSRTCSSWEANRSPWASLNRIQISRIIPGWSQEEPPAKCYAEVVLINFNRLTTTASCLHWQRTRFVSNASDVTGPDLTNISLLVIPCIIYYVTNKETLNLVTESASSDCKWHCILVYFVLSSPPGYCCKMLRDSNKK